MNTDFLRGVSEGRSLFFNIILCVLCVLCVSKNFFDQFLERFGAVGDGMFVFGVHLGESDVVAARDEDGVVAEAFVTAWGVADVAVDFAADGFDVAVRPGEGKDADEECGAIGVVAEFVVDLFHGEVEVFALSRPAGGVDAGVAV